MINRETGRQLASFSLIGVCNTLIHLVMVMGLVELFSVYPVLANGVAFINANLFSFWANSRWSFRAAINRQRYIRFFVVSLLGLTVSVLASMLGETLHWHYLLGVLLTFIFLPLVTFLAHRNWTWNMLN
jgi:putative flippase GtrA